MKPKERRATLPKMSLFARALDRYYDGPGEFDPTDPKCEATKAWRAVERSALMAAHTALGAMFEAELVDVEGRITAKGRQVFSGGEERSEKEPDNEPSDYGWAIKLVLSDGSIAWIDHEGAYSPGRCYRRLFKRRAHGADDFNFWRSMNPKWVKILFAKPKSK